MKNIYSILKKVSATVCDNIVQIVRESGPGTTAETLMPHARRGN